MYGDNPIPELEFAKYGYDFKRMQKENFDHSCEHHFPKGVTFTENEETVDTKHMSF